MRDALSILDKIVSFTNSEVTYNNTLEHLNILDADYYFKLMACMLEQDLAGAMLLFDDINKKGFEGETLDKIVDAIDLGGLPAGTTVTVRLPLTQPSPSEEVTAHLLRRD